MEFFVIKLLLAVYSAERLMYVQPQPRISWQPFIMQQTPCHFHKCSIFPLNNSILLRGIRCCKLVLNACILTKFVKFLWGVFSSIIRPHHLHFTFTLIFSPSFKLLEDVSNFRFKFHKMNPAHSCVIINESNIELTAIQWWCSLRSSHISVY